MFTVRASSYVSSFHTIAKKYLRDCPARRAWLKVVSINRTLLKGEAPGFSADFHQAQIKIFTDTDKDKDMDKDTDKDTDRDMDKSLDKDTDTETDKDTDMELEYYCYISIQRYSPCSTVWINCDTWQRKFQQRYKLVALLPNENCDMQILKKVIVPFELLSKWCVSGIENISMGLKKRSLPELHMYSSWK